VSFQEESSQLAVSEMPDSAICGLRCREMKADAGCHMMDLAKVGEFVLFTFQPEHISILVLVFLLGVPDYALIV
jgi:hypothetical protein